MARRVDRIRGYDDVRRCCKEHEVEIRPCSTGHVMLGPMGPDNHYETVTQSREYGPRTSSKLTKLFKAFGLLTLVLAVLSWLI